MEDNLVVNPIVNDELPVDTLAPTDDIIPAPADCGDGVSSTPDSAPLSTEPAIEPVCGGINVAQFFGTIQESVTIVWKFHLKTRKYSAHKALNDFYTGSLDIVDDIIEQYQGINGIVEEPFVNIICPDGKDEVTYLNELKSFVESNKCVLGDHSEINSTIDNFLGLIDSTLGFLCNYNESLVKSFDAFCYENLNEECSCEKGCCDEDEENTECSAEEEEE